MSQVDLVHTLQLPILGKPGDSASMKKEKQRLHYTAEHSWTPNLLDIMRERNSSTIERQLMPEP